MFPGNKTEKQLFTDSNADQRRCKLSTRVAAVRSSPVCGTHCLVGSDLVRDQHRSIGLAGAFAV